MKKTAFYNIHKNLKAKIIQFAGFEMPIHYSGTLDETRTVRNSVGVFDVSHMGEIEVHGKDALNFIQKITTNDASKLVPYKVQYSAMCYTDGGIVDDLLVYNLGTHFMLVVNAANKDKDFDWMKKNLFGDVKLIDKSNEISLLAVQGPRSIDTLQKLTNLNLQEMKYYTSARCRIADEEIIISRTGYTGELGFELYFSSDVAIGEKIWQNIFEAGKEFGIKPIGLGARDTLRLEMGFCLYGNDIDETTNTLEAGLDWITKLDKGDFNGKEAILKAKQNGLKRKLIGFKVEDKKFFPRQGYNIYHDGNKIGVVTSGTFSPILGIGIGMGYVPLDYSQENFPINIIGRGVDVKGIIVKPPFIKIK